MTIMNTGGLVWHILCIVFVYSCLPYCIEAQTFKAVRSAGELVPGKRYVFTSPASDEAVFVAVNLTSDELGLDYRPVQSVGLNADGMLETSGDGVPAVFELTDLGKGLIGFRDIVNNRWLAYPEKKKSSNWASLYTYPEDCIKDGLHRTFVIKESSDKTYIWTSEKIQVTSTRQVNMGIVFRNYGDKGFRLCDVTNESPLCIYRQIDEPDLDSLGGDWTFNGDWDAGALCNLDFSEAERIDFTKIVLPEGWNDMSAGKMPSPYVWTYVRSGEAGLLPSGWPNIVECSSEPDGIGQAVTLMEAFDGKGFPPKYAFRTAAGKGLKWYRDFPTDGGWSTLWLPFGPQSVRNVADDCEITSEILQYEGIVDEGVVFRLNADISSWKAGVPVLWRAVDVAEHVCFCADDVIVSVFTDGTEPVSDGFYTVCQTMYVTDDRSDMFFLNTDGTSFVRAMSGSWIEPYRAYLYLPDLQNKTTVRLILNDATEALSVQLGNKGDVPCYDLSGRLCGWTNEKAVRSAVFGGRNIYICKGKKFLNP